VIEALIDAAAAAAARLARRFAGGAGSSPVGPVTPDCGQAPLDLREQRLFVSSALGTYFAGLLESPDIYTSVPGQVWCPAAAGADPLRWIQGTLTDPAGHRIAVLAAAGGMGKTTVAATITRCLFQTGAIGMILGDSAKRAQVDAATGRLRQIEPGFGDLASFHRRLAAQVGLTGYPVRTRWRSLAADLASRLAGQRALIVLDNLDTVDEGGELLESLRPLLGRDVRALVTSRVAAFAGDRAVVANLRALSAADLRTARVFVTWHVERHRSENPALAGLLPAALDRTTLTRLLERTGGIPLVVQVVLGAVTTERWDYLDRLPSLLPGELLDFLYADAWAWLDAAGPAGRLAQHLLRVVAVDQARGRRVTSEELRRQARMGGEAALFSEAMRLLAERFLLVDREPRSRLGRFAVVPALRDFILTRD